MRTTASSLLAVMMLLAVLTGCAGTSPETAQQFIRQYGIENPHPQAFKFCYGHGCRQSAQVQLAAAQWAQVEQAFYPRAQTPLEERQQMVAAVGLLERLVGRSTGTDADIGGSFPGSFRTHQLDCIDESINTSTYLTLMADAQLIRYHQIMAPAMRGYMLFGWPHFATVLVDQATQERYVIDSWFLDNGQPPFVVPLAEWKGGWDPPS